MLPKKRRVSTIFFSQIMAHGVKYHSAHFLLTVIPCPQSEVSRWAATVSKKVAPTAVQRNSIRRKINGFLQKNIDILPQQTSGIIFAKQGMEKLPFKEYRDELYLLLKRLK